MVIIGGGGQYSAAAYYLAREHGITNVRAREGLHRRRQHRPQHDDHPLQPPFTPRACSSTTSPCARGRTSSEDFDLNLFYANRGHFTLAPHRFLALRTMRWRAE